MCTDMKPAYDGMLDPAGHVRASYQGFAAWLDATAPGVIARKREEADITYHRVGITFAVHGEEAGKERLIPFDIVPRIIPAAEWQRIEAGLRQRVKALNAFLHDIYHDQEILKAGRIPAEQVLANAHYRAEFLERTCELGDLINSTYFWSTDEFPPAMFANLPAPGQPFHMPPSGRSMA